LMPALRWGRCIGCLVYEITKRMAPDRNGALCLGLHEGGDYGQRVSSQTPRRLGDCVGAASQTAICDRRGLRRRTKPASDTRHRRQLVATAQPVIQRHALWPRMDAGIVSTTERARISRYSSAIHINTPFLKRGPKCGKTPTCHRRETQIPRPGAANHAYS